MGEWGLFVDIVSNGEGTEEEGLRLELGWNLESDIFMLKQGYVGSLLADLIRGSRFRASFCNTTF